MEHDAKHDDRRSGRFKILEIQVADIEGQITDLDQDVNFLFDEQVIQDERLFSL